MSSSFLAFWPFQGGVRMQESRTGAYARLERAENARKEPESEGILRVFSTRALSATTAVERMASGVLAARGGETEARPLLLCPSWPFYPCARAERVEATASSKGGKAASSIRWSKRRPKAAFHCSSFLFPVVRRRRWRQAKRETQPTSYSCSLLFLSLSLSKPTTGRSGRRRKDDHPL